MERTQIFDLMGELKLYGMKAAFDEIMATAVKRQHEPQRIVGDLLSAEINEKQARSIKYQLTIAKLPLAKDIADFQFDGTPINQTLVNDLAGGGFIAQQRNVVLVGGTGTGKTHLASLSRGAASDPAPVAERVRRRKDDYRALLDRLPHRRDIVETGNDSWRFKSRDDDQATRARLASAIPASSDETSATGKPRRAKGSKLDADEGSNLHAD